MPRGRDDRQLLRLAKPARMFEELVLAPDVVAAPLYDEIRARLRPLVEVSVELDVNG